MEPIHQQKRVLLAVDSANLYCALDNGARLDYEGLLDFADSLGTLVQASIYVPRNHNGERDRGFLVALKRMGFTKVVARPYRQQPDGRNKSDLDISIALDIWEAALRNEMEAVILASGDSDFVPLVERLVDQGIDVYIIGPDRATAWELIVAATWFLNASEVDGLIQGEGASAHITRESFINRS
jgi:uncharacterized LabA/DUF88 family protein